MLKKITPLFLALLLFACDASDQDVHNYWVNSYTVPCDISPDVQCLQFQKEEEMLHGQWKTMASRIDGFDYEPGFLYDLQVREVPMANPAADGSSVNYVLVKVERKMSDPLLAINSIWVADRINGEAFKVTKGNDIPRIEINIRANSISGTDGCNFFSGKFEKLTASQVTIGPMAQTKKACLQIDYADAFMQALVISTGYNLSANQQSLSLVSDDQVVLTFKRAQ